MWSKAAAVGNTAARCPRSPPVRRRRIVHMSRACRARSARLPLGFCRNNRERLRGPLTWQASKSQGIELVSGGFLLHADIAIGCAQSRRASPESPIVLTQDQEYGKLWLFRRCVFNRGVR